MYIYLLVIIILIYIIYNLNKKVELYDVMIDQPTTLGKCGNICTSIYGCAGFAKEWGRSQFSAEANNERR